MDMPQIRYFLALSEELNFTRAAKQCGVSQPSLTNGIIELERHFGGALFRRKPGVALTVLGRASLASPEADRAKRGRRARSGEHIARRNTSQSCRSHAPPRAREAITLAELTCSYGA
jgi:DNA-binding transcriptional LysR family regulator